MTKTGYLFCVLCLICGFVMHAISQTAPATKGETGRYQVQGTNGPNTFLVDTETGKTWQFSAISNAGDGLTGNSAWFLKDRLDTAEQIRAWMKQHPPISSGNGSFTVTDPRGVAHTFPSQQQADAFKKAAGLQ